MHISLYNKYRPKVLSDVKGQNIIRVIEAQIIKKNVASTGLFFGPSGCGKTTVARITAMALMCPNRSDDSADPCGTCPSCIAIASGKHRDVMEINCANRNGVDDVRELITERMYIAPTNGEYRIFLLDEAQMYTTQAQNALLKTMEEPPPYVKIFLATTDPQKLLTTIKTRCQQYSFKKINNEDIIDILKKVVKLEDIDYDEEGINMICAASGGSPRSALSLLEATASLGATEESVSIVLSKAPRQICIKLLSAINNRKNAEAYQIVTAAKNEDRDLSSLIEQCVRILVEEVARVKLIKDTKFNPDIKELIDKENGLKGSQIIGISSELLELNSKIRQNVPADLIIPVGILKVIAKLPPKE